MLHIVRHGRTAANASGRLQGRLDLPIDEVGRAQVAQLTRLVPNVDRLITSPALRARQTAEVFATDGVVAEVDERWREIDYGVFEGVAMADIPVDVWRQWSGDPDFVPEGGESQRALAARVFDACAGLADEARHREVVVVSHVTPVKMAVAWALGVDIGITWRTHVDQASVTRVEIRDRGPVLAGFNLLPR